MISPISSSSFLCKPNSVLLFHRAPITTGTSVIGIQFKDGVLIAADILGSYGSLARFRNLERVMKVNDNIILGAGGDYADYQCLKSSIERKMYVLYIYLIIILTIL